MADQKADPKLDIGAIADELWGMTVAELRIRYGEVWGEATRSGNRDHLVRRILWRVQAQREGGLPERARRKALEMADDADLRLRPPRVRRSVPGGRTASTTVTLTDNRIPMPGALLRRQYKGQTLIVRVLENGFEFRGEVFSSLSGIANRVTGSHWNGTRFFGLDRPARRSA